MLITRKLFKGVPLKYPQNACISAHGDSQICNVDEVLRNTLQTGHHFKKVIYGPYAKNTNEVYVVDIDYPTIP